MPRPLSRTAILTNALVVMNGEPHYAAGVGGPGGIHQQVHQHLLNPAGVSANPDGTHRRHGVELELPLLHERTDRLRHLFDERRHVHGLQGHLDVAIHDAGRSPPSGPFPLHAAALQNPDESRTLSSATARRWPRASAVPPILVGGRVMRALAQ